MKNRVILYLLLFCVSIFFINGCSSKLPPNEDISKAKISLMKAKESDADTLATDQFESAKNYFKQIQLYMDKKDFDKAKYMAQKAYIEAKLAYKKAENAKAKKDVDLLSGEVKTIKKDFATLSE